LISLGNKAIFHAGVVVMEAKKPKRDPTQLQNIAFKPITSSIINGVTLSEDWLLTPIHYSLIDPAFLLGGEKLGENFPVIMSKLTTKKHSMKTESQLASHNATTTANACS
jgi:hypothetical protein